MGRCDRSRECQILEQTSSIPKRAIRSILNAYPEALLLPRGGCSTNRDLPIHTACQYQTSSDVLEELLRIYPITSIKRTKWKRTPLLLLWESRPKDYRNNTLFWNKFLIL
mmetsp:Transcript_9432/g.10757  ORF Transcript_9432/g.10757 Transcript_9432/m.10757 type:complete len:110 (+) Transcript_9432:160-489(+)